MLSEKTMNAADGNFIYLGSRCKHFSKHGDHIFAVKSKPNWDAVSCIIDKAKKQQPKENAIPIFFPF